MRQRFLRIILIFFILSLLVDLGFLNWQIFRQKKPERAVSFIPSITSSEEIREEIRSEVSPTPTIVQEQGCPATCLSQIYEATASLKFPTPVTQTTVTQVGSQVKEFFVSFGSGSTKAGDWEDITGLAASIDSTKYGKIKSVVFEAAMAIPNGNQGAWARLFNATDKHPVWFSEVYLEGGTPKILTSQSITLDSGNKLYQVQMKTTLKDLANLNQARVKITTE